MIIDEAHRLKNRANQTLQAPHTRRHTVAHSRTVTQSHTQSYPHTHTHTAETHTHARTSLRFGLQALKQIKCERRLMLTGTPLQVGAAQCVHRIAGQRSEARGTPYPHRLTAIGSAA
jgi:hypothetical protein